MSEVPLPAGTMLYYCPLFACDWTHAELPPGVEEIAASMTGDVLSLAMCRALLVEEAVAAHLRSHDLLEWVTEVTRLRAVEAGTVTVGREDLEAVLAYARHFDVDDDPAMARVTAAAEVPG